MRVEKFLLITISRNFTVTISVFITAILAKETATCGMQALLKEVRQKSAVVLTALL